MSKELEDFWASVSEMRIMRERLWDFQAEREEQLERRALLADQGQEVEQSDGEFDRCWDAQILLGETDLRKAEAAADNAREQCNIANITIPTWAELELSCHSSNEDHNPGAKVTHSPCHCGPTLKRGDQKLKSEGPLH